MMFCSNFYLTLPFLQLLKLFEILVFERLKILKNGVGHILDP